MPITTDIKTFTTNYHTTRMATLKSRLKGYTSEEIQEYIDEKNKEEEKQQEYCCKICKSIFITDADEYRYSGGECIQCQIRGEYYA